MENSRNLNISARNGREESRCDCVAEPGKILRPSMRDRIRRHFQKQAVSSERAGVPGSYNDAYLREKWHRIWIRLMEQILERQGFGPGRREECLEQLKRYLTVNPSPPEYIGLSRMERFILLQKDYSRLDCLRGLLLFYTRVKSSAGHRARLYTLESRIQRQIQVRWSDALNKQLSQERRKPESFRQYPEIVGNYLHRLGRPPGPDDAGSVEEHLLEQQAVSLTGESRVSDAAEALVYFYQKVVRAPGAVRLLNGMNGSAIFSRLEVEQLLNAPENESERLLLCLAYRCGLRPEEIRRLRVRDIDIGHKNLRVSQGHSSAGRTIPMDNILVLQLGRCLDSRGNSRFLFEGKVPGRALTLQDIDAVFARAAAVAGVSSAGGMYALRPSLAAHLLETGADLRHIQAVLGFNSMRLTRLYLYTGLQSAI